MKRAVFVDMHTGEKFQINSLIDLAYHASKTDWWTVYDKNGLTVGDTEF